MSKLETIEGIGPSVSAKLEEAGIGSCEALLEQGATAKARAELAAKTGLSEKQLLRFVNHADLMRIKGVGGEFAELLEAAGVDSVPELAQRNAASLAGKLAETNEARKLTRVVPSESQVAGWIDQAKGLSKVVQH